MHEISIAAEIIDELKDERFAQLELDVSALSLHDSEHSREELEQMLKDKFPSTEISVRMVRPSVRCSCGFSSGMRDSLDCPECGKKMTLDVFKGYKVTRKE